MLLGLLAKFAHFMLFGEQRIQPLQHVCLFDLHNAQCSCGRFRNFIGYIQPFDDTKLLEVG